ncbi:hypothetical protein ACIP6P_18065 [Streptomyces sp. NPDC088729]|uniref:hypothetical protein n=1 Tax=Streptomyces sp. NPDC088729 TaxID=3365876 RepID=UPI00381DE8C9
MSGDYWEDEVFSTPPLDSLRKTSASDVFDWMELNFPFVGGKIDWRRVGEGHKHWRFDNEYLLAASASREICARIKPGSVVEHVGDGLSPYGVLFTGSEAASITAALLEVPEHHYFLAEDRAWIVVVSFEGDLDILDRVVT